MLGCLQRHLLRRLSEGVFVAIALVYTVCFLVGWMDELEKSETIGAVLSNAHASSWRTLTSVAGLCLAIGAGIALSFFARERGGLSVALSGRTIVKAILPAALLFSAIVGYWRWAGPLPDEARGVVHWGESEWGWIRESSDSTLDWLWIRQEGRELSLSQGHTDQGDGAPPVYALELLGDAEGGLPAWFRDALLLFVALLTLAVRLDRRPGSTLVESVPIVILAHWGPMAVTPLVLTFARTSMMSAELISYAILGSGLLIASRLPAAWSVRRSRDNAPSLPPSARPS